MNASSPPAAGQPAPPLSLQAPPLWRRLSCWLYEGMLMFGVVFLAGYLFSTLTQTRHALQNRHGQQIFLFLVLGAYFVWFWSKGHTLAMKTWHIRIVDRLGQPISKPRALTRYVLSWLWVLPPLGALSVTRHWQESPGLASTAFMLWVVFWALLSRVLPQRQFLHDVLAGTYLIHQAPPAKAEQTRKWWQL